jgi:competence protein ComEC
VARRTVVKGASEAWDGVSVRVLGPVAPEARPLRVRNDDSLVLEIGLGGVRFLLTGDVEKAGELALDVGPVVALKVPHHGSRSSSSDFLLDRARPTLALVSAGFRSRFSHPDPSVMARYRARGIGIFTTASDGAITLATDGQRVWVKTFRGTGLWSRVQ